MSLQQKIGKNKSQNAMYYISKGNQTQAHIDKSMSAIKWSHNNNENKCWMWDVTCEEQIRGQL
jgi:hypothetical protein